MSNANEPAFPVEGRMYGEILGGQLFHGMTKRELFAAMAMQGYISSIGVVGGIAPTESDMARYSVDMADALLAALATPSEERKP